MYVCHSSALCITGLCRSTSCSPPGFATLELPEATVVAAASPPASTGCAAPELPEATVVVEAPPQASPDFAALELPEAAVVTEAPPPPPCSTGASRSTSCSSPGFATLDLPEAAVVEKNNYSSINRLCSTGTSRSNGHPSMTIDGTLARTRV